MKKHKLTVLTTALTYLFVPLLAQAADSDFDSMFGMTCSDLNCWVQGVWVWMSGALITVSTIMLVFAGYIYLVSGGDPGKVAKAHQIMLGVASGLGLLILSYFLLTQVLGLPISVWSFR